MKQTVEWCHGICHNLFDWSNLRAERRATTPSQGEETTLISNARHETDTTVPLIVASGWLVIAPCAGFAPLLACELAGLQVDALLCCEQDSIADRVLSEVEGLMFKNLGDVTQVDYVAELDAFISAYASQSGRQIDKYKVLVTYGAPCQAYCVGNANRGVTETVAHVVNLHCKIFLDAVKKRFPHAAYLIENTAHMTNAMKMKLSTIMGSQPLTLDSGDFGVAMRKRYFWLNFGPIKPLTPFQHRRVTLADVDASLGGHRHKLPTIKCNGNQMLSIAQLEACNTIERGATQLSGRCEGNLTDNERSKLVGQCAAPAVMAHLLSSLSGTSIEEKHIWRWAHSHGIDARKPL